MDGQPVLPVGLPLKTKTMIIISGCPRSGTSLMSSILREVVGAENFHGAKWPQEGKLKQFKKNATELDLYVRNKTAPGWDNEDYKDLNPNGFWEGRWTVKGCSRYDVRPGPLEGAKIVSQGLAQSNPEAISRVIYMVRDPRAVAKSQERLKRKFQDAGTVHSPEMFINVHTAAARWIVAHKPDLVTLDFDDLLADPVTALASLDAWTGEAGFPGRFAEHAGKIRQRLRRSADHETPEQSQQDDAWEDAEEVYEALKTGDFAAIAGRERKKKDPQRRVHCTRFGAQVPAAICRHCLEDETTRNNLRKTAQQRKIAWLREPCVYECRENGISIEDSIANNHWRA